MHPIRAKWCHTHRSLGVEADGGESGTESGRETVPDAPLAARQVRFGLSAFSRVLERAL